MTLDQQISDMAEILPNWICERIDERTASWEGVLRPYKSEYLVRIEHTVPLVIEYHSLLWSQPLIEVLEPRLQRQKDAEDGEASTTKDYGRQARFGSGSQGRH